MVATCHITKSLPIVSSQEYERTISVYVLYMFYIDIVEIMEYNCHVETKNWSFIELLYDQ
jgi:hypothetical protein